MIIGHKFFANWLFYRQRLSTEGLHLSRIMLGCTGVPKGTDFIFSELWKQLLRMDCICLKQMGTRHFHANL